MMSHHEPVLLNELERQRKRLLDLSAANRLLHYRHPKRMAVRVIDELPGVVFQRLSDGRSLTFVPVPEPEPPKHTHGDDGTATVADATMEAVGHARAARQRLLIQEAERLGINTSYELPATPKDGEASSRKHQDRQLQALYFPEELEAQLRHIQGLAHTAIQETGANLLHLVFGFLRWHEAGPDSPPRRAPLVLMPVNLRRNAPDPKTRIHSYDVAYNEGEAIEPNVTLLEKLKQDFGLTLPPFEAKEGLDAYFEKVQELLLRAPTHWALERQISLALLSFGRLLMWRDLNPELWPKERPLFSNPQLRLLLGENTKSDANDEPSTTGKRDEVYDLDSHAIAPLVPPVVVDADSSQHSVLVDVLRGENLVVQGPPGTGKSQTITNLIGAALASGKTVLFVTQKLAALEVVSRRLTEVGLGGFCLELHSHKTQKQQFMEDLRRRLEQRGMTEPVAQLATVNATHKAAVRTLREHTGRLHAPYGALQMTPYAILWRVRRLESEVGDAMAAFKDVRVAAAASVTAEEFEAAKSVMRGLTADLTEVLRVAQPLALHPWAGVRRSNLTSVDCRSLVDEVAVWKDATSQVEKALVAAETLTGARRLRRSVPAVNAFTEVVRALSPPPPEAPTFLFAQLRDEPTRAQLHSLLDEIEKAQQVWAQVPSGWRALPDLTTETMRDAEALLGKSLQLFSPTLSLAELVRVRETVNEAVITVERGNGLAMALAALLGIEFEPTPAFIQAFAAVLDATAPVDEAALEWRESRLFTREAEEEIRAGAQTCAQLKEVAKALDERFNPDLVPPLATLKAHTASVASAPFIPWLSGAYRAARRDFKAMAPGAKANKPALIAAYGELLSYHSARERFCADARLQELLGQRFVGTGTRFDRFLVLFDWWRAVEIAVRSLGPAGKVLVQAALERPIARWREALAAASLRSDEWALARKASSAVQAAAASSGLPQAQWVAEPVSQALASLRAVLRHTKDVLHLAAQVNASHEMRLVELAAQVRAAREAYEAQDKLGAHREAILLLGAEYRGRKTRTEGPRAALGYADAVFASTLPAGVGHWLLLADTARRHVELVASARELDERVSSYNKAALQVRNRGQMAPDAWEGTDIEAPLTGTLERLLGALERANTLAGWASYLRQRQAVADNRVTASLLDVIEAGQGLTSKLPEVFEAVFFRSLADTVHKDVPEIDSFSGSAHSSLRMHFAQLDRDLIKLQGAQLAHQLAQRPVPQGVQAQKVAGLTELRLIEHEVDKKKRHIPIRELVHRAGGALQALMPCFMMGPQSVAQYLPPGKLQFDLVVMDEASQLRPEDALGAISRGGQLVVVGDPEQLPPTSFFDLADQEEEGEEAAEGENAKEVKGPSLLDESESILVAAARRFPMRMLRWHYRSRHPGLIAFSNREFYNGDLVVFPAPGQQLEGLGVRFEQVAGGLYESNRNDIEARAIVEAVREHARVRSQQSLIVVTLNVKQRDHIEDLLSAAEKEDVSLASFIARWAEGPEPFEVKNLESVQGDERDVVFVSITFGPNREKRFIQNFGPINQSDGYRRLNVLFTRAKCALTVFASFDPSQMRVDEGSPRGMRVLQKYLYEAQGRQVAHGPGSDRGPDSDFEVEVARALAAHRLEVVPQVGVAGYFIDLAVRHPKYPGRYILGVECDGDRYHRAKSARDRDRLRDSVLEGLGWKLHRIWSTDWYRDPMGQTQRVLTKIRSILAGEGAAE